MNIKAALEGADQFQRAIRLADAGVRARTKDAIKRGTKAVAARAISKAPKRSGELASTIRDEYSKDEMVGFVKVGYGKLLRRSRAANKDARERHQTKRVLKRYKRALATTSSQALSVTDLGVYAPVVERGDKRRHKPAQPFVIPALREERPTIITELTEATKSGLRSGGLV